MNRIAPCLALLALASAASGQSFNLDVGDNLILFPAPSDAYAAAAGQSGRWNAVETPYAEALVDLAGNVTSVTVSSDVSSSYNNFMTSLTGDDEDFMEDTQFVPGFGAVATWTFSGLASGSYDVYTYAWDEVGSVRTDVEVIGSNDPLQTVGGSWSGSPHVLGVTYALHSVDVVAGTLTVELTSNDVNGSGSCNGFQLVRTGEGLGSSFCTANANSSGLSAQLSAAGSALVTDQDVTLTASRLPAPGTPGIFFFGPEAIQVVFGDGFRCVGGMTRRVQPPAFADGALQATRMLDFGAFYGQDLVAGASLNFQFWYRDPMAMMAGFNLSDGYNITFQ